MTQSTLTNYELRDGFIDEVYTSPSQVNDVYEELHDVIAEIGMDQFKMLNESTKLAFANMGITYAIYGEGLQGKEKIFPFDMIPRILDHEEWAKIEKGVVQRNTALNMFISDIYHDQKILKEGIIPSELIKSSVHYIDIMEGFHPPGDIHTHISGTDLIRHRDGEMYILEDNLRNPSGVSYVVMNRKIMHRCFTPIFKSKDVLPVSTYPQKLLDMMKSVSPRDIEKPVCVLLTPGQFNSAYYEHSFLAQEMGIELVEGRDLFVDDNIVYMKTTTGPVRVDVIYRRIDDRFLDPVKFNKESVLGVNGLMQSYFSGNVTIINAPGNGFSDDKAVCAYVPDMIKFYLDEEPIINNVPTYICSRQKDLEYVINNLTSLVVKPVDMSGGYGVTVCDSVSKEELEKVKQEVLAEPRRWIAQPKMFLSTHMTYIEETETFEPRHIDLRTFGILGKGMQYVLPGGLTRVALKKGSLIVNSSQGGGSKDTWVIKK